MKILVSLAFVLVLLSGCERVRFGYSHNPAWVLENAFKAVNHQDHDLFNEVSAREALCVYGNPEGMTHLSENIFADESEVRLEHKVLDETHFSSPEFVGFWSYFRTRYQVDVVSKQSKDVILEAYINCDFGTADEKDDDLLNRPWKKYHAKECRLVKLVPRKFKSLPVSSRCELLKVKL